MKQNNLFLRAFSIALLACCALSLSAQKTDRDKKNADEARELLDKNGIQCEVFTFTDSKGTLFYRVRVGPYTTKSEAEYWRTRIIKINDIDNAGDSYITSTTI